jgi:uncharacterized protein YcbK (DUF882 family)
VPVEAPPLPLSGQQIEFIRKLLAIAETGRFNDAFLTSWWRSPEKNEAVGGVSTSRHLSGLAVDIDLPTANLERFGDLAKHAFSMGLSALIYWGGGKSYVHLQDTPLKNGARLAVRFPDGVQVVA